MNQEKWVIVVRRDGDKNNGKVYNNFVTGENLIFTNL